MKVDLNSPAQMKKIDVSKMMDVLISFPEMVPKAYELARPKFSVPKPDTVVVLGMGGSAIGGDFLSAYLAEKKGPQVIVNREYELPAFIGPRSLVFAVSYSGNTEETLSAYEQASQRGCPIVTISSGGKLETLGDRKRHITLPTGLQPRAAVAYMLMPMLGVIEDLGIAEVRKDVDEAIKVLPGLMHDIGPDAPSPGNPSKDAAKEFQNSMPNIFSGPWLSPVAKRWRTQLNENSKILAREDTIPEMDHNDLVAWSEDPMAANCAVILLRDRNEHPRVAKRMELTRKLGLDRAKSVREIHSRGNGPLVRLLSTSIIGDFSSFYLAMLREADPTPVKVIERLKKELAG